MPGVTRKPPETVGNGERSDPGTGRDRRGRFTLGNKAAVGHGPIRGMTAALAELDGLLEARDEHGHTLRRRILARVLEDAAAGRAVATREVLARLLPVRLLIEHAGEIGTGSVSIEALQAAEATVEALLEREGAARVRELLQ